MTGRRSDDRSGFDMATRMTLVETDLDAKDVEFQELKAAIRTQTQVLTGILISVTTTCIVLLATKIVG